MVFWRKGARDRYWFVQYEAGIPIFVRDDKTDRRVDPTHYFKKNGEKLWFKDGAIYELVLTRSVTLKGVTVDGVDHPKCIAGKCLGTTLSVGTLSQTRSALAYNPLMAKHFSVDARAMLTWGRESIKDHTTAVLELVKNS